MYTRQLYQWLTLLGANNDRAWFAAHRAEYDELRGLWMADLDRLIAQMALWEPGMATQTARTAAYRIYRDTRFSPDKSPYKTYFAAALSPYGRKGNRAGFYLQLGPGRYESAYGSGLYGGIWCPDSATLRKIRRAIVDNAEEFGEIVNSPALNEVFPGWIGDSLKRAPKGFAETDPFIEVLRLKDIGKFLPCDMSYFDDPEWPVKAARQLSVLKPLIDFINYSIEEEV